MAHDCLGFTPFGPGEVWRLRAGTGTARVPIRVAFASDSGEVLRQVACDGLGIALLPTWMVHEALRGDALRPVLPRLWPPPVPIQAVYPGGRAPPVKVKAFLDFLLRRFGRRPYWEQDLGA